MGGRKSGPATAKRAFGQAGGIAVDLSVRSKAEADQVALGRFNQMALGYIDGEVRLPRAPRPAPGLGRRHHRRRHDVQRLVLRARPRRTC